MITHIPTGRIVFAASLLLTGAPAGASAQDLYKSRAEMLNAAALNKQADATIISAMAEYGKAQAEIAKLHQETREKAAHNDLLETETYYKKRAQYHAYKDSHRKKSITPEQYAEQACRAAPAQLTSYQFDSRSGELRWPTLFNSQVYDPLRRRIDHLLEQRTAEDNGAGSQNCVKTLAFVDELKATLREHIRRYTSADYLAARNFLDSLALEAQRPSTISDAQIVNRLAGNQNR